MLNIKFSKFVEFLNFGLIVFVIKHFKKTPFSNKSVQKQEDEPNLKIN